MLELQRKLRKNDCAISGVMVPSQPCSSNTDNVSLSLFIFSYLLSFIIATAVVPTTTAATIIVAVPNITTNNATALLKLIFENKNNPPTKANENTINGSSNPTPNRVPHTSNDFSLATAVAITTVNTANASCTTTGDDTRMNAIIINDEYNAVAIVVSLDTPCFKHTIVNDIPNTIPIIIVIIINI